MRQAKELAGAVRKYRFGTAAEWVKPVLPQTEVYESATRRYLVSFVALLWLGQTTTVSCRENAPRPRPIGATAS